MVISVRLGNEKYDVTVKRGLLNEAEKYIFSDGKTLVVTDDGVPTKYVETVAEKAGRGYAYTFKAGEKSKNADTYLGILAKMLELGFNRGDRVVAVGGGVVGDVAGFAAATYMRGVDFYNIPTTFLSQVDSSVGGKTAIDFGGVKNSVGAFYQPKAVLIDPDVLSTLEPRQLSAGIAESVKCAATLDKELFSLLEDADNFDDNAEKIIARTLGLKRDIVEKDPKESGLRKVLNFGHTVGHAVESYENGRLLHGECVGLGMLAVTRGEVRERIKALLSAYGLPTEYDYDADKLMPYILHDKKAANGGVTMVFCNEIGTFDMKKVGEEGIRKILNGENI